MPSFLKPAEGINFVEHHNYPHGVDVTDLLDGRSISSIYFNDIDDDDCTCVRIKKTEKHTYLHTSYYVGVDWIFPNEKAIYIEPKLNVGGRQTNYLKMLFSALRQPEARKYSEDLFEIKWDKTPIAITQDQDLLTPLLVVTYLNLVKDIVRKGLKKSYYKIEQNLYCRVKGKLMVGKTIKGNALKNKSLNTWCSYDEFGYNGLENRLLKKALAFIKRYLPTIKHLNVDEYTTEVFNYTNPAFEHISDEVNLHDILHTKSNAFYKEYTEALRLAKMILQRFGYNIRNASDQTVSTPPFWIDMSKLFEFYVLSQLKDAKRDVNFQHQGFYGQPDYLLKTEQLIVDAKYKTYYKEPYSRMVPWKKSELVSDIRQLSGYGRDLKVRDFLDIREDAHPSLVIIHANQEVPNKIEATDLLSQTTPVTEFHKTHIISIDLPVI